jgi:alpha-glucosidase
VYAGTGNLVWSSTDNRSFLQAAIAEAHIEEHRGSFLINDEPQQFFKDQRIDTIFSQHDSLFLVGVLGKKQPIPWRMIMFEDSMGGLGMNIQIEGAANRLYLSSSSDAGAHVLGFGEQFSHLDMKGRRLPIFCMEQGIGRGLQPLTGIVDLVAKSGGDWHTSYAGMPLYINSRNQAFFLENSSYSVFDFRKKSHNQIQVWGEGNRVEMNAHIHFGKSVPDVIRSLTRWNGRMQPLPDWTQHGAIIGMQGGSAKVQHVHRDMQAANVPLAGYWLQDWVGQRRTSFGKQLWWNWELDRERYPAWDSMQVAFADDSIALLGYVNPFLVDVDEKGNAGRNLFKEALAAGYLIKNDSGKPYMIPNTSFSAGMVDLTNPCAYDWIKAAIKEEMLSVGIKGWMADFGEALPLDCQLYDGSDPATYHNRYPVVWAKLNREIVEEDSLGQYMFFSRAGYSQSPKYSSLFWLGDQMVTWDKHDGLQSAITGLLSGGLSGISLNHSDIGGYTTLKRGPLAYTRDRELLLRWMEFSAFTALFRSHEGNQPELNVQVYSDSITRKHFALTASWYAGLAKYRKALMEEAAATGLPLARHCIIHYPEIEEFWRMEATQFLLGEDLLVVPVTEAGADEVEVLLPRGEWEHVWSGQAFSSGDKGKKVKVAAPMGQPGLFIRAESPKAEELKSVFTS